MNKEINLKIQAAIHLYLNQNYNKKKQNNERGKEMDKHENKWKHNTE